MRGPTSFFTAKTTLRTLFVYLIAVCMLPLIAFEVASLVVEFRQDRKAASQNIAMLARSLSVGLETEFRVAAAGLDGLGLSRALRSRDFDSFRPQAQAFLDLHYPDSDLSVLAPDGALLLGVTSATPLHAAHDASFLASLRRGETWRASALPAQLDKERPALTLAVPVAAEQGEPMILCLDLPLKRLQDLLLKQRLKENWIAGVIDPNGVVAARVPHVAGLIGRKMTSPYLEAYLGPRREAVMSAVSLDGVQLYSAYSRSEASGWGVSIGTPQSDLLGMLWQHLSMLLALAGVVLALSVWLARSIARRIIVPINTIAQLPSLGMAAGFGPSGIAEIDAVARQLSQANAALREQAARDAQLATVVTHAGDAIMSYAVDGTIEAWNPEAERMFGWSAAEAIGQPARLLAPPDRVAEQGDVLAALARGESCKYETFRKRRDGELVEVSISCAPIRAATGEVRSISAIVRDISARRRHEEQREFLTKELTHRSKNLLAVVLAIARQSIAGSRSMQEMETKFAARVQGLATSHDMLVTTNWRGASVEELARSHLAHFADLIGSRILLAGPKLLLKAEATQNIGLALHELSTNAAKYGALSQDAGVVNLDWWMVSEDGGQTFCMRWRESGGPAVTPPQRRGFGQTVVERLVAQSLDGKVELHYRESGVEWRLRIPATHVLEPP